MNAEEPQTPGEETEEHDTLGEAPVEPEPAAEPEPAEPAEPGDPGPSEPEE